MRRGNDSPRWKANTNSRSCYSSFTIGKSLHTTRIQWSARLCLDSGCLLALSWVVSQAMTGLRSEVTAITGGWSHVSLASGSPSTDKCYFSVQAPFRLRSGGQSPTPRSLEICLWEDTLSTQQDLWALFGFHLPELWSGNYLPGNKPMCVQAHLICFPSCRDRCPVLPVVQCPRTIVSRALFIF